MTAPVPPECDPERVETVARALRNRAREAFDTPCDMDCDQADCPSCGQPIQAFSFINDVPDTIFGDVVAIAATAIAALPPSPAEEAVKRVEALAGRYRRMGATDVAAAIRAALASPAPAPPFWRCARCHRAPEQHAGGREADDCVYLPELASGPAPAPEPAKEAVRCGRGYTDPEHWIDGYYACPGFASPAPAPQGEEGQR